MKIILENNKIETDSMGNELTPEQVNFFKDSKIRNFNTKQLLVCYHATNNDFDAFDKSFIGSGSGGVFGSGFYFTTHSDTAKDYGSKLGSYYLNITNPYDYYDTSKDTLLNLLNKSGYEYDQEFVDNFDYDDWDADLIDDYLHYALINVDPYKVASEMIEKAGYDGIWAGSEIIAFEPDQIKLVSNKQPTNSNKINEDLTLYRVGDVKSGTFFTDDLGYYSQSMTGYKKDDAKTYSIDLSNAKVFDPMKELTLYPNTWSDIEGKVEDFEKYNINYESDSPDAVWGHTSTDDIAYATKGLGYDVLILRDIRGDYGIGKPFNEYVIYNTDLLKPVDGNLNESFQDEKAVKVFAKDCIDFGWDMMEYKEFADTIGKQGVHPTQELYQVYVDTYNHYNKEDNDYIAVVRDKFDQMSTNDIINLLGVPNKNDIDTNSPMFILPNGSILSIAQAGKLIGQNLNNNIHSDMVYVILSAIAEKCGYDWDMTDDGEYEEDKLSYLTYGLDWARVNCGQTWLEDRFYCVLPNHMTSAQYRSLEKWLEWGVDSGKKEVLVYVGRDEVNQTYYFNETFPEDIIKKIKRYYSSGRLYEGLDTNSNEVYEYILNEFNYAISDKMDWGSSYILQDGRFLNMKEDAHLTIDNFLEMQQEDGELDKFDFDQPVLATQFGALWVGTGDYIDSDPYIFLQANHKITSAQYYALTDWLDELISDNKETLEVVFGNQIVRYNLGDTGSDYIINRIKRCYSSGILYENRNELKENMEELIKDFSKVANPKSRDKLTIIDDKDREWNYVAYLWSSPGFTSGMTWKGQKGNPWVTDIAANPRAFNSEFPSGVKSIVINGKPLGEAIQKVPNDVEMFYDRHLKLWTLYIKDEEGNQISNTEYAPTREEALYIANNKGLFNMRESLNTPNDITNEVQQAVDNVMKNKDRYKNQDDLESAIYSAIANCFSGMHGVTRTTSDMIADVYEQELKRVGLNTMNEEFVNELVPGELYHFTHNNEILYGTFKRKTPAWLFFDVEGEEILAKPWDSVATTAEELEELIGLVNKMERDTKIPSQVPNRFTRVPNQHGKPMGESIDHHTYRLTKIVKNVASKIISDGWYKDYDDESTLHKEVVEFVKEILHSDNQDNYIPENDYEFIKDETEVAGVRNKNAYGGGKYEFDTEFCDSVANKVIELSNRKNESNELEQRAKKHKKKSKGMGWHMSFNAGDVNKAIDVFNSAQPDGGIDAVSPMSGQAMGEGISTIEAMQTLSHKKKYPKYKAAQVDSNLDALSQLRNIDE